MRRNRISGVALVVACAAVALAPVSAPAATHQGGVAATHRISAAAATHRITIHAQPNPITAGDSVVIFGRLFGPRHGGRLVHLFHHLAGQPGFTLVQTGVTEPGGAYEFSRLPGRVDTNRAWRVRAAGVGSPIVRERVMAQVTFGGPAEGSTLLTGAKHPYSFSGTVSPAKPGAVIVLQRQSAASATDDWHTIGRGVVNADGSYTIVHRFVVPGDANVRVLMRADGQNAASPSSVLSYQISQAQNPKLTINATPDPVSFGGAVTITGTLSGGPNLPVTLMAHTDRQAFAPVAQATTDPSGNYTFSQMPVNSTFYEVVGGTNVKGSKRHSAVLFEGVRDVLTVQPSATTVQSGQSVTFSGSVGPDHTGHVIHLQRRNASGDDWHTIQSTRLTTGSVYSITHTFYAAGSRPVRILIPGGPENQGTHSGPLTITVTPSSASSLTPAQG